jgi:hypothetical protein
MPEAFSAGKRGVSVLAMLGLLSVMTMAASISFHKSGRRGVIADTS